MQLVIFDNNVFYLKGFRFFKGLSKTFFVSLCVFVRLIHVLIEGIRMETNFPFKVDLSFHDLDLSFHVHYPKKIFHKNFEIHGILLTRFSSLFLYLLYFYFIFLLHFCEHYLFRFLILMRP